MKVSSTDSIVLRLFERIEVAGHVHNGDHVNSIRSDVINYSVRMFKDFAQLAYVKLWNWAPGHWESLNLR